MIKTNTAFLRLAVLTTVLAYVVIVLGAFTRLSDAGLGCPDWPGCYGKLIAPSVVPEVPEGEVAETVIRVDPVKAWTEMIHRYAAGTLGIMIISLAVLSFRDKRKPSRRWLTAVLAALVIFQAALGMWTVTLQLKPLVVMGHLLGGLTLIALLWWLVLLEQTILKPVSGPERLLRQLRPRAWIALSLVAAQIALGGWTSANYAALVCPDFPTCQGAWMPEADFSDGFTLWRGLGVNYEGGVLSLKAATAVHMAHRMGALVTLLYVGWFALHVMRVGKREHLCRYALAIFIALLAQVALGVMNVLTHLPMAVALAHNGVAVLLLLAMITFLHTLYKHHS